MKPKCFATLSYSVRPGVFVVCVCQYTRLQPASFAISQVAGLVANTATVFVASYFMPVLLGKLLAIGASFLVNFSLSHFVVFRKRSN